MDQFRRVGVFVILGILFLATLSQSAYLRNFPVQVRQPDRTVIDCFASGDEFYNWLHDSAGRTIIPDPKTGWYVYAQKVEGRLVPSAYVVNRVRVQTLGAPAYQVQDFKFRISPQALLPHGSPSSVNEIINAPRKGSINNIVIFIRFSDESEFEDESSLYNTMFNASAAGTNSVFNYFKDVSYNQLSVTTTFYPLPGGTTVISYQDSQPRSYYQPYNESTNPGGYTEDQRTTREHTLLRDAVNAVRFQVPAGLVLDGDNDGYVDNVCFIILGSPGGWSSLLWPHMWSLYSYSAFINGKRVRTYNVQLQSSLKSGGGNVGVLCHEMFHTLGSPDLYHYSFDGLNPVGTWDIMEYNSNPPQHMGAYMKYRYGTWISSIPTITSSGTYSLNPLTSSSGNCYKIASPNSSSEYFVVEYRKKTSLFESVLPGEGVLVYRINTTRDGVGNESGPPDEVYIYRPGGTTTQNGTYRSAHFSQDTGRVQINNTTDPSSFLSDGKPGGLDISAIGSAGGTIFFTVNLGNYPGIALSRTVLNFGALIGGAVTSSQSFTISNSGAGTLNWTVTDNAGWLSCTPASGTGNQKITASVDTSGLGAGTYTAAITVACPDATNSPQTVSVMLRVYAPGSDSGPFGVIDTPTDGTSGIEGSLPITGWALDDIEVTKVDIWRDPLGGEPTYPNGYVYIGDAAFVEGARPDVETAYGFYPLNYRAGWGYMMLTNFLPHSGNGTFRIHAIAYDKEGHSLKLGTKTITCDNALGTLPLGTIDTPAQGGTMSGTDVNFGWALTPMPKSIPVDGSTILVWIDGQPVGHPTYNNYRVDIATLFPGYANNQGAIGYYYLDTTKYSNGIHTIAWSVEDSAGTSCGIGSRYFSVINTGAGSAAGSGGSYRLSLPLKKTLANIPTDYLSPVYVKKGYRLEALSEPVFPDANGVINIEAREVDRIEVALGENAPRQSLMDRTRDREQKAAGVSDQRYVGYLIVGHQLRALPIGSTLDSERGVLSWQPGPGFVGEYNFVFMSKARSGIKNKKNIRVRILPAFQPKREYSF
jgi:M6 family metalloprotease-like protein